MPGLTPASSLHCWGCRRCHLHPASERLAAAATLRPHQKYLPSREKVRNLSPGVWQPQKCFNTEAVSGGVALGHRCWCWSTRPCPPGHSAPLSRFRDPCGHQLPESGSQRWPNQQGTERRQSREWRQCCLSMAAAQVLLTRCFSMRKTRLCRPVCPRSSPGCRADPAPRGRGPFPPLRLRGAAVEPSHGPSVRLPVQCAGLCPALWAFGA